MEQIIRQNRCCPSDTSAAQLKAALQRFVSQNASPEHSRNYTATQRDNMGVVLHLLSASGHSADKEITLLVLTVRSSSSSLRLSLSGRHLSVPQSHVCNHAKQSMLTCVGMATDVITAGSMHHDCSMVLSALQLTP